MIKLKKDFVEIDQGRRCSFYTVLIRSEDQREKEEKGAMFVNQLVLAFCPNGIFFLTEIHREMKIFFLSSVSVFY